LRCEIGFGLDEAQEECIQCDESIGEYSDGITPCYSSLNNNVFLFSVEKNENNATVDTFYKYNFCSENCLKCNDNVCEEYVDGAYFNDNKQCETNSNKPAMIDTNGAENCSKENGDIFFEEKCFSCHLISSHCKTCSIISEEEHTVKCSQCQEPFVLKNSQYVSCESDTHHENGNCNENNPS
jgi:hypothetical protein